MEWMMRLGFHILWNNKLWDKLLASSLQQKKKQNKDGGDNRLKSRKGKALIYQVYHRRGVLMKLGLHVI